VRVRVREGLRVTTPGRHHKFCRISCVENPLLCVSPSLSSQPTSQPTNQPASQPATSFESMYFLWFWPFQLRIWRLRGKKKKKRVAYLRRRGGSGGGTKADDHIVSMTYHERERLFYASLLSSPLRGRIPQGRKPTSNLASFECQPGKVSGLPRAQNSLSMQAFEGFKVAKYRRITMWERQYRPRRRRRSRRSRFSLRLRRRRRRRSPMLVSRRTENFFSFLPLLGSSRLVSGLVSTTVGRREVDEGRKIGFFSHSLIFAQMNVRIGFLAGEKGGKRLSEKKCQAIWREKTSPRRVLTHNQIEFRASGAEKRSHSRAD